jgi:hypothetical protein
MARTEIKTEQVGDEQVTRQDLNVSNSSQAVIARVIAGAGIQIASTGVDTGTGDVTITATGGGVLNISIKTGSYTLQATDDIILVNNTASVTMTLPTAVGKAGKVFYIKKIASNNNHEITIDPSGTEQIEGESDLTIKIAGTAIAIVSDGTSWHII